MDVKIRKLKLQKKELRAELKKRWPVVEFLANNSIDCYAGLSLSLSSGGGIETEMELQDIAKKCCKLISIELFLDDYSKAKKRTRAKKTKRGY